MRLGGKDVELKPGSMAARLFENARAIRLRFRHRYEVDPKYIKTLEDHGMIFSGKHPTQPIMQILELPSEMHPYFVGTQAHPELTSRPLRPQPLFMEFCRAALKFSEGKLRQPQAV
jgi:CTP synthase